MSISTQQTILDQEFFLQPALTVAENLLSKYLVREMDGDKVGCMITEVEAYDGFNDKASHAHKGKTPRNRIMFEEGGFWYVYLVYGMHWMLNITTGPKGYPAAVLIRGVKDTNGPARLTKFLNIDKKFNEKPAEYASGLWIEDRGEAFNTGDVQKLPRVGINYAEEWIDKPYRFKLI